jgi:citronellol/citronellal dehydrogenase
MPIFKSCFRNDLFKGQVFIVTGGGSGIGRCVAHELAACGALVVIASRDEKKLKRVCDEIMDNHSKGLYSGTCHVEMLNIRDVESCKACVKNVMSKYHRIDGLVNNAGGQFAAPAAMISSSAFEKVVLFNLVGTFNMCSAAFAATAKDRKYQPLTIVNMLANIHNGFLNMVHSSSARAGIENMTKTLCREWGPQGVRINCIAPGVVIGSGMKNYPQEIVIMTAHEKSWQNPSGRLSSESEVSSAIVFLLSPAASYINGTTLKVDGGESLSTGPTGEYEFSRESKLPMFHGFSDDEIDTPVEFQKLFRKYVRAKL